MKKNDSHWIKQLSSVNKQRYLIIKSNVLRFTGVKASPKKILSSLLNIKTSDNNNMYVRNNVNSSLPTFFISCHLGNFKLIAQQLFCIGYKLIIPITKYVYEEQSKAFLDIANDIANRKQLSNNIIFVDIEENGSLSHITKLIREGYSLLLYIDGNSGTGGMKESTSRRNHLMIPFLGQEIHVRRGAYFIYKLFNKKVTLTSAITDEKGTIINFAPITKIFNNESEFITYVWKYYESIIIRYPEQWEGWLYVNAFVKISARNKDRSLDKDKLYGFNSLEFDFLDFEGQWFLFDLLNVSKIPISMPLYMKLHAIYRSDLILSGTECLKYFEMESLCESLVSAGVLIEKTN